MIDFIFTVIGVGILGGFFYLLWRRLTGRSNSNTSWK